MQCLSYKKYVVIVASGTGKRMGLELPKQFLLLGDKPILLHTLISVYNANKNYNIILVLNKDHIHYWNEILEKYNVNIPHKIVLGGKERFNSVQNAINSITDVDEEALVAVHDGVRPFAGSVFEPCFKMAEEKGNAISAIKSVDSIRMIDNSKTRAIDRNSIMLVHTPQCFKLSLLRKAYEQEYSELFTDDASVVESLGETINICEGIRENIKITTPFDLKIAETLI